MTKEQREEMEQVWNEFAKNKIVVHIKAAEYGEFDYYLSSINSNTKHSILDFIESEVEKAKKEGEEKMLNNIYEIADSELAPKLVDIIKETHQSYTDRTNATKAFIESTKKLVN